MDKDKDITIIHGNQGTRDEKNRRVGVDKTAGHLADKLYGMKVEVYPANWTEYGPSAGPIRNQQMLDEGKPDVVVFFHSDLKNSKGTKDMVRRSIKAGIPVMDGVTRKGYINTDFLGDNLEDR